MNKLGLICALLCFSFSLWYSWEVTIILFLYFVATKTDTVILIDQKIELLVNMISKKL